ncbi:MAG: hypothetical protein M1825_006226 [Sarcosagium campestre]|nr:MAG: hypothetical protein M1825_006226 [Sarcosagium campestre]
MRFRIWAPRLCLLLPLISLAPAWALVIRNDDLSPTATVPAAKNPIMARRAEHRMDHADQHSQRASRLAVLPPPSPTIRPFVDLAEESAWKAALASCDNPTLEQYSTRLTAPLGSVLKYDPSKVLLDRFMWRPVAINGAPSLPLVLQLIRGQRYSFTIYVARTLEAVDNAGDETDVERNTFARVSSLLRADGQEIRKIRNYAADKRLIREFQVPQATLMDSSSITNGDVSRPMVLTPVEIYFYEPMGSSRMPLSADVRVFVQLWGLKPPAHVEE